MASDNISEKSLNRAKWIEALILVVFFVFAFYPQLYSLFNAWYSSDDYSHAFFIIPITLWLIWEKKEELETVRCTPSTWGIGIVILSLAIYLLASLAEIVTISSFALVFSVWGIVIYLYGFSITKAISFPLIFLFFMVPVPSQIYTSLTLPLQLLVSKVSFAIISLTGVPIYREGNVLHLPEMTLQVVEACSGLRSMIALLTISAIFSYLTLRTIGHRLLLFLSGVPIAIVVNIFRVTVMTLLTYFGTVNVFAEPLHSGLGLSVFVLAFLFLFSLGGLLSWIEKTFVKKY